MNDLDKMPWGKYAGRLMQDVPASYLHYMWTERGLKDEVEVNPVARYIKDNLRLLEMEYKDGIWE